ncbi:MAG TPA: hypothetical protein VFF21_00190 [Flavobacteriaceae bacterium]|nr:hypothetical protein [Flavobacteriaceae bacterium]
MGTELKDGPYLRYFLKIAYEKNSFSNTLKKIITFNFRENEGTNSIYNPERVEDNIFSLDLANPSLDFNHFKLIQKQSEDLKQVDGVGEIRAIKEDIENLKRESTLSITGESKVEAYRDYALRLKEKYENMILTYEQIKNLNLSLISDYETLKNKLRLIREDLLNLLVDLYGDQIKTQEPELFDITDVNWKGYDELYPKLDLFYNTVNERIALFKNFHEIEMRNILISGKQNVNNFLHEATKISQSNKFISTSQIKGIAAGAAAKFLVSSTMAVLRSRSEAKKTIAEIEVDISRLKVDMNSDVNSIIQDIINLGQFHTEIRDRHLPTLQLFTQQISNIIEKQISPNYAKIIENNIIRECRDSNVRATLELREIELELVDQQKRIKHSEKIWRQLSEIIQAREFEYNYLQQLRPTEPKLLAKIFSPFKSRKIYEETLDSWTTYCEPFILEQIKLIENKDKETLLQQEINDDMNKLMDRKNYLIQLRKENGAKIHTQVKMNDAALKPIIKKLLVQIKNVSKSSMGPLEKKHSVASLTQAV